MVSEKDDISWILNNLTNLPKQENARHKSKHKVCNTECQLDKKKVKIVWNFFDSVLFNFKIIWKAKVLASDNNY